MLVRSRNCSQEERDEFERLDIHEGKGWRAAFVAKLQEEFADYDLTFSIGAQSTHLVSSR